LNLAAERHRDDHAENDDDGRSHADTHDAHLVHIQQQVDLLHDGRGAVSRERLPTRSRRRSGRGVTGSGGRGRRGGGLRIAGFVPGLRRVEHAAFELLLEVIQAFFDLRVAVILLHLVETLVEEVLENGLISGGHDGAGDHEDEDEQQGDKEESEQAPVFPGGAAAAEEADNDDADGDDDEENGRIFDCVCVDTGNIQIEDVDEALIGDRPDADGKGGDADEEQHEGEEKEDVLEKSVAAFQYAHFCLLVFLMDREQGRFLKFVVVKDTSKDTAFTL